MIHDASKCEFGDLTCEGKGGRAGHICDKCLSGMPSNVVSLADARDKRLPVLETNMEAAMIACAEFIEKMVELGHPNFCGGFAYGNKSYHLHLDDDAEGPLEPAPDNAS